MVERLWSPWRHDYIAKAAADTPHSCVFCEAQKNPADDEQHFILHRGRHNFIILNLYPYISGHLMIAPYAHVGELDSAPKESTDEMMISSSSARPLCERRITLTVLISE